MKPVQFLGDSQAVLRAFPNDVRQEGMVPAIAKPFGKGIFELRDQSSAGGTFRVAYVLIVKGTIHVLHAFQKKSQRTSRVDVAILEARLKSLKGSLR